MPAGSPIRSSSLPPDEQLVVLVLGVLLAPLFLIVPMMVASVLAADAFAGEKERRTLETLLHLPIARPRTVLRESARRVPARDGRVVGRLHLLRRREQLRCVAVPRTGIIVPTKLWAIVIFWLAPAVAALGMGVMVRVSARARTAQEANQLGGAVILPLIFLAVGQSTGLLFVPVPVAFAVGALVWVIALWLVRSGAHRFTRDRIAARPCRLTRASTKNWMIEAARIASSKAPAQSSCLASRGLLEGDAVAGCEAELGCRRAAVERDRQQTVGVHDEPDLARTYLRVGGDPPRDACSSRHRSERARTEPLDFLGVRCSTARCRNGRPKAPRPAMRRPRSCGSEIKPGTSGRGSTASPKSVRSTPLHSYAAAGANTSRPANVAPGRRQVVLAVGQHDHAVRAAGHRHCRRQQAVVGTDEHGHVVALTDLDRDGPPIGADARIDDCEHHPWGEVLASLRASASPPARTSCGAIRA